MVVPIHTALPAPFSEKAARAPARAALVAGSLERLGAGFGASAGSGAFGASSHFGVSGSYSSPAPERRQWRLLRRRKRFSFGGGLLRGVWKLREPWPERHWTRLFGGGGASFSPPMSGPGSVPFGEGGPSSFRRRPHVQRQRRGHIRRRRRELQPDVLRRRPHLQRHLRETWPERHWRCPLQWRGREPQPASFRRGQCCGASQSR